MSLEIINIDLDNKLILKVLKQHIGSHDFLTQEIFNAELKNATNSEEKITEEQMKNILFNTIMSREIGHIMEKEIHDSQIKDLFENKTGS